METHARHKVFEHRRIALPVDANGRYPLGADKKYGPDRALWSYSAPNPADFYSVNISGVQRLPNGNTLICAGAPGIILKSLQRRKSCGNSTCPVSGHAEDKLGETFFARTATVRTIRGWPASP
jgi:hypothetical protein